MKPASARWVRLVFDAPRREYRIYREEILPTEFRECTQREIQEPGTMPTS